MRNEQGQEVSRSLRPVRRVGTMTLGMTLVGFGIVYLLRLIWSSIPLLLILRFWPAVMIFLGVEVLLAGLLQREFVIDKAAIVLTFLTLCFILCMAVAEWVMEYGIL